MDQLERRDRVVRMLALELVEHRGEVCPFDVAHLRDDGRGGHEALGSYQIDGVRDLLIKRSVSVGKSHEQAPLMCVIGAACHKASARKDGEIGFV